MNFFSLFLALYLLLLLLSSSSSLRSFREGERNEALYLSYSVAQLFVCTAVRHLLNCVRRCSLLLLLLSLPSFPSLSVFSPLLLRRRLHLLSLRAGTCSSSLARAGERHRTTENKVFLRFPVLLSRSLSLTPLPSRIYAQEAEKLCKCERIKRDTNENLLRLNLLE